MSLISHACSTVPRPMILIEAFFLLSSIFFSFLTCVHAGSGNRWKSFTRVAVQNERQPRNTATIRPEALRDMEQGRALREAAVAVGVFGWVPCYGWFVCHYILLVAFYLLPSSAARLSHLSRNNQIVKLGSERHYIIKGRCTMGRELLMERSGNVANLIELHRSKKISLISVKHDAHNRVCNATIPLWGFM